MATPRNPRAENCPMQAGRSRSFLARNSKKKARAATRAFSEKHSDCGAARRFIARSDEPVQILSLRDALLAWATLDESLREARCGRCRRVFHVCSKHDFGRIYCGKACSDEARRTSTKRARRRHEQSPEGLADHAARQREYRARVTDQGGRKLDEEATVCVPTTPSPPLPADDVTSGEGAVDGVDAKRPPGFLHCAMCGRTSRFVRRSFLRRSGRSRDG